jgi:Xaa-Pro aminopeptidase/Xaa-Pro dipeptidase
MRHDAPQLADRVRRLRALQGEADALLLMGEENIRYLTGFTGGDGALMAGPDWMTLLVDGRYVTQARSESSGADVVEFRKRVDGIGDEIRKRGIRAVGFDAALLSVAEHRKLQEALPGVAFSPLSADFELLRSVKEVSEIERIRKAAGIAARAFQAVREMIGPGIREDRIALELEYRMRREGAEQISFATIVASGANSALPHATPGQREIADGDCVTVDFGAVCEGYHSDETCTFFVGRASARQREVYRQVLEAHDRVIRSIREGQSCGEMDHIARATLAETGLATLFAHGTGHGVGLEVHEAPRLAAGRGEILRAGMVVTVEPGVYIPGEWGIRIEDTVLVTREGCEILTPTPKDLTIIGGRPSIIETRMP